MFCVAAAAASGSFINNFIPYPRTTMGTFKEKHCSVSLIPFYCLGIRNFCGLSGKSVFDVWGGEVDHNVTIFYVKLKYSI